MCEVESNMCVSVPQRGTPRLSQAGERPAWCHRAVLHAHLRRPRVLVLVIVVVVVVLVVALVVLVVVVIVVLVVVVVVVVNPLS